MNIYIYMYTYDYVHLYTYWTLKNVPKCCMYNTVYTYTHENAQIALLPERRAAARGFSRAAAARYPKSGIPSGGFAHFYGSWVFHMMFYSLFPSPYKCVDDAPFHPKKHAFLKNLLKNSSTTHY